MKFLNPSPYPNLSNLFGAAMGWFLGVGRKLSRTQADHLAVAEQKLTELQRLHSDTAIKRARAEELQQEADRLCQVIKDAQMAIATLQEGNATLREQLALRSVHISRPDASHFTSIDSEVNDMRKALKIDDDGKASTAIDSEAARIKQATQPHISPHHQTSVDDEIRQLKNVKVIR